MSTGEAPRSLTSEPSRPLGELAAELPSDRHRRAALPRGIAGGVLAALVGGLTWALVVTTTNYELGFVAWGIGFVAGTAVVVAAGGAKGLPLQAAAVASALLGILIGKYVTFVHVVRGQIEEIAGSAAAANVSYFSLETARFFGEEIGAVFGGFDLLWAGLAIFTAWRIPQAGDAA